jgi:regulatory protein
MKITAIKQQVKRPDRYSIYLDGNYVFSLGETDVLRTGVHTGMELDSAQIEAFQQTSSVGKLFDRVLNLFSYRQRSEWEVRDYLRRKQADADQVNTIIAKLTKLGYIDDQKFALSWVESRRYGKPISQRKLRAELMAKRIDTAVVDAVLKQDTQSTNEQDILQQLIAKKRRRYPDQTKFMQYLARQGFRYDDIKQALQQHADD